ncbi:terpenoid cyclases/protein prenyltransferase alpha-alpha toroid [Exophiala viscosa]|uniref:terpenoid cyclases/protein prenyltransferase alpha-alpha toroid n=1 Tax=Exophiala viscosa TaxID=2486360 RepID=UPI0021A24AB0|nr:terpenoid cyclases/protein prenyltransferase alpha-alpha toroid [Exophiala viscosa]
MGDDTELRLNIDRHIKYWKRCAQILPEPYATGESSRMSFGFFIVAALDLLGALETAITIAERQSWIEWIYTCQVPFTGGFRGFTGTMLGSMRSSHNWHWDPANLPNTYFALATLIILGDDLSRVSRAECMRWVCSLQRLDGSFGEFLGEGNAVEGADDMRLCMCAVGVMKILQGNPLDSGDLTLDKAKILQYIANCQSHEGGLGQAPLLEAHSGLNYCAIATLSFLGLLRQPPMPVYEVAKEADVDTEACIRWMLDRQTMWVDEDEDDEDEEDDGKGDDGQQDAPFKTAAPCNQSDSQRVVAGFCGRCGKVADTCYCFWNVGALAVSSTRSLPADDSWRQLYI